MSDPDAAAPRPGRRCLGVVLVSLVGLAVVAVPAGWCAYFALASFTGCFLECTRPEPLVGLLWSGLALALLALPVAAGLLTWRARSPVSR